MAVIGRKLSPQPAQIESRIDLPQKMIRRYPIFQTEIIKKTVLTANPFAHHG